MSRLRLTYRTPRQIGAIRIVGLRMLLRRRADPAPRWRLMARHSRLMVRHRWMDRAARQIGSIGMIDIRPV
jgi:hypothetical protein